MTFVTPPRLNQKVGLAILRRMSTFLMYDMGTGKTKIALDALRYYRQHRGVTRGLVLVPNTVTVESWLLQAEEHAPDLKVAPVGPSWRVPMKADVAVSTYAALIRAATQSRWNKKRSKKEWMIFPKGLDMIQRQFDAVVFDESTALKNWQSLTFKVCKCFLRRAKLRVAMSGTPMGRDPQDLWAQFYVVDGGEALGSTLGLFRETFFKSKKNYWGGYEYTFQEKKLPLLQRMMAHSSIRYTIDECVDLPDRVYCERPVVFGEEQWQYYRAALERAKSAKTLEDLQGSYMSMRQLASGFAHVREGEYIDFQPNVKLDALMDLLAEIPSEEKVVLFNVFVHSGDLISRRLTEEGIGHARIYSGTKDKAAELRRFLKTKKCRVLVGNSESTSKALNLQVSRYVLFYEQPSSPITREQAERRCWRPGQDRKVLYYDLFLKRSIEEKLWRYLRQGRDLFKAIVDGKESLE